MSEVNTPNNETADVVTAVTELVARIAKPASPFMTVFGSDFSFSKSLLSTDVVLMAEMSQPAADRAGLCVPKPAPIEIAIAEGRAPKAHSVADGGKTDARNMYKGEYAALPMGYDVLDARFHVTFSNKMYQPNTSDFRALPLFRGLAVQLSETGAIKEVIERVVQQIASGEWLWRNAEYSDKITVTIDVAKTDGSVDSFIFNTCPSISSMTSLTEAETSDIAKVRDLMLECIPASSAVRAIRRCVTLSIAAKVQLTDNRSQIFPSQLMKIDASGDDKYGEFYKVSLPDGRRTAALRAVKSMNKVRCIDDWSVLSQASGIVAPISPMGTLLQFATNFRPQTGNESFYALVAAMGRAIGPKGLGNISGFTDAERAYVAAQVMFGGLFTEEDPEKAAKKAADAAATVERNREKKATLTAKKGSDRVKKAVALGTGDEVVPTLSVEVVAG